MALKGDRYLANTEISYFMNEVAERGGIAVVSTVGSGAMLDQDDALVTYSASQSGKVPVGLLLADMVNKDLTQTHLNFHKDETQKGSKVPLLREGWVVTDMLESTGLAPNNGQVAYLGVSGLLTTNASGVGDGTPGSGTGCSNPKIGRFEGKKDEDGYVRVYVKLPQV